MFEKEQYTHERRNRGRNMTWDNSPFTKNVKPNIAKQFLHLLDTHFGRNHKYYNMFNRNNVKIGYSCMDHMIKITNSYNKTNGKIWNCRNKSSYQLDNKCLANKNVYKAEVKINNGINELSTKVYFEISKVQIQQPYNVI